MASLLRRVRQEAGLTLKKAAELAGINYPYLSAVENERANPTMGYLLKLLKVYSAQTGRSMREIAAELVDEYFSS